MVEWLLKCEERGRKLRPTVVENWYKHNKLRPAMKPGKHIVLSSSLLMK
jgi:hypothetical protein